MINQAITALQTRLQLLLEQRVILLLSFLVVALFSGLRLYGIHDSLLFFNDMGRDYLYLERWLESGVPPLLGPQNSVLPFNQSPAYFYILMPLYLLTGGSLFSSIYTVVLFHLAVFGIGLLLLAAHKKLLISWIMVWFIYAIHPQLIIQHRYVWNPSFVAACITLSVFSLLLLKKRYSTFLNVIFSAGLALAAGFSYSAVPTLMILLPASLLLLGRSNGQKVILGTMLAGIVVHSPLLFFEARHNFTLTRLLMNYEKLEQVILPPVAGFNTLLGMVLPVRNAQWSLALFLVLFIIQYLIRPQGRDWPRYYAIIGISFVLNLLALIFLPVSMQPHFIFGVFSLLFVAIALLRPLYSLPIVVLLSITWLSPALVQSYFRPAWRSVPETITCAQAVCQQMTDPTYISVQSRMHNYHAAPEYQFLFKREGCEIYDIYRQPSNEIKTMLVVADGAPYSHGRTAYDELTLFGKASESASLSCLPELKVHVLKRD